MILSILMQASFLFWHLAVRTVFIFSSGKLSRSLYVILHSSGSMTELYETPVKTTYSSSNNQGYSIIYYPLQYFPDSIKKTCKSIGLWPIFLIYSLCPIYKRGRDRPRHFFTSKALLLQFSQHRYNPYRSRIASFRMWSSRGLPSFGSNISFCRFHALGNIHSDLHASNS